MFSKEVYQGYFDQILELYKKILELYTDLLNEDLDMANRNRLLVLMSESMEAYRTIKKLKGHFEWSS